MQSFKHNPQYPTRAQRKCPQVCWGHWRLVRTLSKRKEVSCPELLWLQGLAAKANIPARDQLTSLPHRCWNRLPGFAIQNTSSPHVQSLYNGSVGQISVFICFIARNFSEMNVRYDISGFDWSNWTYPTPGAHQSSVGTRVINHFYIFILFFPHFFLFLLRPHARFLSHLFGLKY